MTYQQENDYFKYEGWAIDNGADTSLIEVNEDGEVMIAVIEEVGTRWIGVPVEFTHTAISNA